MSSDDITLSAALGSSIVNNNSWCSNKSSSHIYLSTGCVVSALTLKSDESPEDFFFTQTALCCLNISNDGKYLAGGERGKDSQGYVWNLSEKKEICRLSNGHKYGIGCLVISPDNKFIITVGFKYDKTMIIWSIETGIKLLTQKLSNKVYCIRYHSSGNYFVTSGDRHMKYWNISHTNTTNDTSNTLEISGKPAAIIEELSDSIFIDMLFGSSSNSHNIFCITSKGFICQFSETKFVENYKKLDNVTNGYCITWITTSSNTQLLGVGCSNGIVYIIVPDTLEILIKLPLPHPISTPLMDSNIINNTGILQQASSSYSGKYLSQSVSSLNIAPNTSNSSADKMSTYPACYAIQFLSPVKDEKNDHYSLVCSYANKLMYTWNIDEICRTSIETIQSTSNTLKIQPIDIKSYHTSCIWDVLYLSHNYQSTATVKYQSDKCLKYPEGTFVTASADNTLRFWTLNPQTNTIHSITNMPSVIYVKSTITTNEMAYTQSAESIVQSTTTTTTTTIPPPTIDLSMSHMTNITQHSSTTTTTATTGNMTSGGFIYNMCQGIPDMELFESSQEAACPRVLAQHPYLPHLLCGTRLGEIMIYDLITHQCIKQILAHASEILSLDFSSPMIPMGEGQWTVDVGTYTTTTTSPADSNDNSCISYASNALVLLASAGRDRLIHIYDTSMDYALLTTLDYHTSSVTIVRFSTDGQRLITCGGDQTMYFFSVQGPEIKVLKSITTSHPIITGLSIDPTNKFAITCGQDKRLNVWNIITGKLMRSYKCNTSSDLYKVDIDPSGMFVAVCGFDKIIRIYDFFSGEEICMTTGHSELITSVKFTPDGQYLISISGDHCIMIWKLPIYILETSRERLLELYSEARRKEQEVLTTLQHKHDKEALISANNTMDIPTPVIDETGISQNISIMDTSMISSTPVESMNTLALSAEPEDYARPVTAVNESSLESVSGSSLQVASMATTSTTGTSTSTQPSRPSRVNKWASKVSLSHLSSAASSNTTTTTSATVPVTTSNNDAQVDESSEPIDEYDHNTTATSTNNTSIQHNASTEDLMNVTTSTTATESTGASIRKRYSKVTSYSLFGRKIIPGQNTPNLNKFTLELTQDGENTLRSDQPLFKAKNIPTTTSTTTTHSSGSGSNITGVNKGLVKGKSTVSNNSSSSAHNLKKPPSSNKLVGAAKSSISPGSSGSVNKSKAITPKGIGSNSTHKKSSTDASHLVPPPPPPYATSTTGNDRQEEEEGVEDTYDDDDEFEISHDHSIKNNNEGDDMYEDDMYENENDGDNDEHILNQSQLVIDQENNDSIRLEDYDYNERQGHEEDEEDGERLFTSPPPPLNGQLSTDSHDIILQKQGKDEKEQLEQIEELEESAKNLENWLEQLIRKEGELVDHTSPTISQSNNTPKAVIPHISKDDPSEPQISYHEYKKNMDKNQLQQKPLHPLNRSLSSDFFQGLRPSTVSTHSIQSRPLPTPPSPTNSLRSHKRQETVAAVSQMNEKLKNMGIIMNDPNNNKLQFNRKGNIAPTKTEGSNTDIHHFAPPLPPSHYDSAVQNTSSSSSILNQTTENHFIQEKERVIQMKSQKFQEILSAWEHIQDDLFHSYNELLQSRDDFNTTLLTASMTTTNNNNNNNDLGLETSVLTSVSDMNPSNYILPTDNIQNIYTKTLSDTDSILLHFQHVVRNTVKSLHASQMTTIQFSPSRLHPISWDSTQNTTTNTFSNTDHDTNNINDEKPEYT